MDDEVEELDYCWITHYKETEAEYDLFYKSEVNKVNLFFYYINEQNEHHKIKKAQIDLIEETDENGYLRKVIHKETLLNKIEEKENYQLIAAYKYNILTEPEDIVNEVFTSEKNYFTQIKLDDADIVFFEKTIVFEKTIGFFQDLNALYLILKKINKPNNKPMKTTKKNMQEQLSQNKKTRKKNYQNNNALKNKLKNII